MKKASKKLFRILFVIFIVLPTAFLIFFYITYNKPISFADDSFVEISPGETLNEVIANLRGKYNFDYIKAFTELDFQHENLLVELTKINSKYLRRDNSMPNYMNRIDAELGYFPIIYKTSKDEYSLFHFVANNNTSINGEDTSYQFNILYGNYS